MKTISQLLRLKQNPYYKFTQEEQAVLDDFLLKQSERKKSQRDGLKKSSAKIHANVHNKNIVDKETGIIPIE